MIVLPWGKSTDIWMVIKQANEKKAVDYQASGKIALNSQDS